MSHFEGPLRVLFEIDGEMHDNSARTLYRWDPSNRYLVTVGSNNRINVFRRDGELVHQFPLSNNTSSQPCIDVRWDKDGQSMAIMQKDTSQISLWTLQDMHNVRLPPPPCARVALKCACAPSPHLVSLTLLPSQS